MDSPPPSFALMLDHHQQQQPGMELERDLPPPLSVSLAFQQQQEAEPDLDQVFSSVLMALMRDEISAQQAIAEFHQASIGAMLQYRDGSSLLHRAASFLHKQGLAAELQGQAASWQLLQALYCSGDSPAGANVAGAADTGACKTLWQQAADLVNNQDRDLRRCAQVVAWLESLAVQQLLHNPGSRFAHCEGVWRETLITSGHSSSSRLMQQQQQQQQGGDAAVTVELDPDAPSRGRLKLAAGDRQGEERLAQQLWHLIRAGKVREARQLCVQAGQAWRSVSLAGGGPWGPLPVGAAATDATEASDALEAAADLAWQVEGGLAASRLAWKWSCYAAAEAAANGTPGNRWEAAVYAALCGHVQRMLPVCGDWEDEAWCYCRAWLDLASDALLLEGASEGAQHAAGSEQDAMNGLGLQMRLTESADDMVSADLLAGCVELAAGSGYSNATDGALMGQGLAVMTGELPLYKYLGDSERPCFPQDFRQLGQLLAASSREDVRRACQQRQHILQLRVMSEDWPHISRELAGAASTADERLQQLAQQRAAAAAAAAAAEAGGDVAMQDAGLAAAAVAAGAGGWDDEVLLASAEVAAGELRFAAHFALGLRALGRLLPPEWQFVDAEDAAELSQLEKMLSTALCRYGLHLASDAATLRMVPLYLCHLQQAQRQQLLEALVTSATALAEKDEDCQEVYLDLVQVTEAWFERQGRLEELIAAGTRPDQLMRAGVALNGLQEEEQEQEHEEGDGARPAARQLSSCLYGDLRFDEVRLLLGQLVSKSMSSSAASPFQRCQQLRWLFYSYTGALARLQQQHGALGAAAAADLAAGAAGAAGLPAPSALGWSYSWRDALQATLRLAAELALNPGFGSAGLATLMGQVVPAGFEATVSRVAQEQLAEPRVQLQVQRQLQALVAWRAYAALDADYQAWKAAAAAEQAAAGPAGGSGGALSGELAVGGEAVAAGMLQLAQQDALELPASAELVQLLAELSQGREEEAVAEGGGGVGVGEAGQPLAVPWLDEVEAGDVPVQLFVALTVAGSGAAAGDAGAPFVRLQEREQHELRERLADYLHYATLHLAGAVRFDLICPDASTDLAGTVVVDLRCYEAADGGPGPAATEAARLREQRKQHKAWEAMVALAAQLLCGAGRPAAGGGGGGGGSSVTYLEGMPRLCVVQVSASVATALGLCRRRTTSKLLRRSAKMLLQLAKGGHWSPQLDALIAAAGGEGGSDLLRLLSPRDAGRLLVVIEQVLEQGGPLQGEPATE